MNKIKLETLLNDFHGDYYDLYEKINVIDGKSNVFDKIYYDEIVYLSMFIYHLKYGIHTLSKKGNIPNLFDKVNSYDEFKTMLENYRNVKYSNEVLPEIKNAFQEIWRLAEFKLLSRDSWTKIYSSSIYKKEVSEVGKLYVSVDNNHLYQFACLLLSKSLKANIRDFEFKVNNDPSINRRDNVVIYFTKENLNQYLSVIDMILKDNPSFQINEGHLLGYEVSDGVVLAKDYVDGSSFTEKACKAILKLKEKNIGDAQIVELIDNAVSSHLSSTIEMVSNDKIFK